MGVPIDVWVECMKRHPALYRFEGLHGNHHTRWSKDSFFKDVREACVADEEFMNRYMEDQADGTLDQLGMELNGAPPKAGGEDDYHVESYASWLRAKLWHRWDEPENVNHAPARKIIEKLEPPKGEHVEARGWGKQDADGLRWAWSRDTQQPEYEWDVICQDEPEYYLKEHPPIEMWSHAYKQGVPLNEILMICPGCHNEPVQEKSVDRNPVRFYCGLCGAEACPDEGETLESWAEAVGVKLWPFKVEKKEAVA